MVPYHGVIQEVGPCLLKARNICAGVFFVSHAVISKSIGRIVGPCWLKAINYLEGHNSNGDLGYD